ncbi:LysE family translocator [Marinomonas sp. PE14-40]|uniref:LysE family translocator n=1 Tax=Marinomonas sp. PE14-40 TaxID=3060621 RepID=UPI003F67EFB3
MPSIEILLAFTLTSLLMSLSPGPSNLYVMARSIAQGVQGGLVAAAGLGVGSLIHVAAAVLGLSVLFSHSPTLYMMVKLIGALYLIYLGVNYWRAHSGSGSDDEALPVKKTKSMPLKKVFIQSIIVEVTNPKTALFFIALLPQFVVPESGPIALQLFVLGMIAALTALPCDILVAVSSSKVASWLLKHKNAQVIQDKVSGSILLGMGSFIAVGEVAGIED